MITQARLKELLHYCPDTGCFTWIAYRSGNAVAGSKAGHEHAYGRTKYRQISVDNRLYLAHRLAWMLIYGRWPAGQIDHIDGDGMNNKISNLRDVSRSENQRNQRLHSRNTSGQTGVYWDKNAGKWIARIKSNNKRKNLGRFEFIEDAIAARKAAEKANGYHENHGMDKDQGESL